MTRFLPKLLLLTLVRVALPAAADPGHLPVWVPLGPGTPGDRAPWELQLHRLPGGVARVELTLPGFHRVSSDRGDSRFEAVVLAGTGTTRVPGLPALPVIQERIPAAAGAGPLVLDVAVETVRVQGIVPLPFTPRPTRCGGDWPARESCDAAWYAGGEPFPATWATAREAGILRGVPVVEVTFSPFRYHPGTRDLEVARRVVMTLALPPLDPASLPPRAFSRPFADEVKRSFLDPLPLMREGPSGAAERLLVLAHDDLAPALEELLAWKRTTGLDTELVLLSSVGTTWQAVAGFLADQYFNAEVAPTYVLLAGDGEGPATVPWVPSPLGCASDFLYSTLDGDDLYAELLVGRFSADTADQAALQAAKVIAYERDLLPEIAAWVPRSACLSSSEGNGGSNDDVRSDIICGVQQDADFETLKLYHSLGNDTASNVTAALNQGLGWVTYLGHGSGTSWATTTPEYTVSHVHALANGGRTPFIMDVSCSNGAFEQPGGDCLAEAWLRTGGPGDLRGGIGSWSASTPAAWDEPAEMAVGFTRGILEQGIHRYGEACLYARGYMLETLPGYGSLEEVCHQYVLFGDPSLRLRTRVPWVPEVQLPALVPVGLPSMEVAVSRGGEPVAGASVVVRKEGDVYTAAFTGPDGVAHPVVAASSPGALEVWVTAADATAWHGTVTVAATGCGILLAGTAVAACEAAVPLTLYDQDLNQHPGQEETASVTATAPGAAPVAIVLTEAGPDSSKFTGSLVLSAAGIPGSLVATHGEGVTVTYGDADCEGAATEDVVALAVDCLPPEIGGVSVQGIGPGSATVVFSTDEAAVGLVRIGVAPPPGQEHPGPAGVTSHAIPVAGLVPSTTYFVEVQATDPAGNSATDDAGGAFYVFETPACTPLCEGLQCGANGCGGVCGTCCPDQACVNGLCSGGAGCVPAGSAGCGGCPCEACVCDMDPYCCNGHWDDICASECQVQCGGCPNQGDCTGRECGDDGCGGSCGDCPGDLACVQGLCGEPCVPSCTGKECGDDGCGGSCGDCPLGTTCSPGQECLDPCHGVGFEGCCDGVVLHYCDGDHEIVADCAAQGLVCGWMENVGWYDCATKADEDPTGEHPLWCEGACKPSCAERECGDDACGGTCGTCPEGEFCTEAGLCEAPCPGLPAAGCCDGDLLRFCDLLAGAADDADCAGEGLRCGWDSSLSLYNCVAQPAADPSGLRPRACPGTCTPACGGRACGDDGCGGTCGACVPGFSCLEGICTLAPPPEDVLEPAGDTGDAGGAGRTAGGCGPGPGTPAPGLLLAALALLSGLPRRKAEPRGGPLEH